MEKELKTIWDALHGYRDGQVLKQGDPDLEDQVWDEICGAMANITESLGLTRPTQSLQTNRSPVRYRVFSLGKLTPRFGGGFFMHGALLA